MTPASHAPHITPPHPRGPQAPLTNAQSPLPAVHIPHHPHITPTTPLWAPRTLHAPLTHTLCSPMAPTRPNARPLFPAGRTCPTSPPRLPCGPHAPSTHPRRTPFVPYRPHAFPVTPTTSGRPITPPTHALCLLPATCVLCHPDEPLSPHGLHITPRPPFGPLAPLMHALCSICSLSPPGQAPQAPNPFSYQLHKVPVTATNP